MLVSAMNSHDQLEHEKIFMGNFLPGFLLKLMEFAARFQHNSKCNHTLNCVFKNKTGSILILLTSKAEH